MSSRRSRSRQSGSSRITEDLIANLVSMLQLLIPEICNRCSHRVCHSEVWSTTSTYGWLTSDAMKKLLEMLEASISNPCFFGFMEEEKEGIRGEEGALAFYSDFSVEDIINILHALLQEKSLPDILRNKKEGELAARSIEKIKGKAAATSGYDTGESSNSTSSLNSTFQAENHLRYELDHLSIPLARHRFEIMTDRSKHTSANASGRSLNGHTEGTMVITGRGSPESTSQRYPLPHSPLPASASRNEQAQPQEFNAKCRDNPSVGTVHYQQPPVFAPTGADIEVGAFPASSEPAPETIAISKEPPAVILISLAFALLSGNSETLRGPVERVLLGVMTVGFICSFTWLLMGSRRRRGRLSSLLQWTAVWAMFVSFFLVMTLLMTH